MCVRGHAFVCQRSCICVLEVMHLCVRGHVFVCQRSCICARGVEFASFYDFFYWILGLFRQCDIFCFAFYLFYSLQNLVFKLSVGYLRDHLLYKVRTKQDITEILLKVGLNIHYPNPLSFVQISIVGTTEMVESHDKQNINISILVKR